MRGGDTATPPYNTAAYRCDAACLSLFELYSIMADDEKEKPFLVPIQGHCSYWLLDPPAVRSRIVKDMVIDLNQSCDCVLLTDHFLLVATVEDAIDVIQQHLKTLHQIQIGSQCNQVMKHAEISAVYLAHLLTSANFLVPKLHYAMSCLFYHQPPRELEGKDNLCWIADVASVISDATNKMAFRCKRSSEVVMEAVSLIYQERGITLMLDESTETPTFANQEHEGILPLLQLTKLINKSAIFWVTVATHCTELKVLADQIQTSAKIDPLQDEFEQFKQQVIKASAGWIALGKVCSAYLAGIPPELYKYANSMLPHSTSFEQFAKHLGVQFEIIYSTLMGEDYEMQDEVKVYSTWVRPVPSTSGAKCLETAQTVVDLFHEGNARKAEKVLVDLKWQSARLSTMTEILARKLEALEPYCIHQQEKLMRWIGNLEEEERCKELEKIQLQIDVSKEESNIAQYKELKEKAESYRRAAEEKRREAEERVQEVRKWWWVPVYGLCLCIREVVQNNRAIEKQEAKKVADFQSQQNTLQSKVQNARSQISNIQAKQAELNSEITNLKAEYELRFKNLQEMKVQTAYLKETVTFWKGFVNATQHGENRADFLTRLIERSNKEEDPDLILKSQGSMTASKNFSEAFKTIERLIVEGECRVITYNFKCAVCQKSLQGLPMPVNEDNVVCNECAHRLIE